MRSHHSLKTVDISSVDIQQHQEKEEVEHKDQHLEKNKQQPQTNLKPGVFSVIFTTFSQICSVLSNLDIGTASTLVGVSMSIANSYARVIFSLQCLYFLFSPSDLFESLKFETFVYVLSPIVKILFVVVLKLLSSLTLLIVNYL